MKIIGNCYFSKYNSIFFTLLHLSTHAPHYYFISRAGISGRIHDFVHRYDLWPGLDYLGSCKVNGHVDHDEIVVTASRGDFKAIKLFVENEGIQFDRVMVHYGNGTSDRMDIRKFIPAGGETRVLDLAGSDRVVRKVTFYYESNGMTYKKGKVVLYGRR